MATGARIFKAEVQIADVDRSYYQSHSLTLACHPSETDERMMIRLLAFMMYAHEHLEFGRGISTQDEPDLWQKDLTGSIELWIDIGQRDERDVRKACGKSRRVVIICYGSRGGNVWWTQNSESLSKLKNLTVLSLEQKTTQAMAKLADRNMSLLCNIEDGDVSIISGDDVIDIHPTVLLSPDQ